MDFWKNKIAVVMGATSAIGAAVALDLAKAGLQVIGLARRRERVEELARQSKGRLYAFECDISRVDSIVKVFKQIGERFGRVDVLINMTSRLNKALLDVNLPNEDILKTIDINISGVIISTREACKLMQRHKDYAYIININNQTNSSQMPQGQVAAADSFSLFPLKNMTSNETKRIKMTSIVPTMVKIDNLETLSIGGSKEKEINDLAAGAKAVDSKFLIPKDVSDVVMYLLTTPHNINITEINMKPTSY